MAPPKSQPRLPAVPFSVLLPVYARDRAAHLQRAFDSVTKDQTLPPTEVVIVQDGPVRDSLESVLRAVSTESEIPVTLVRLEDNRGLAHALQAGLSACAYDIVARSDADDISLPERFAMQLELICEGYDLVGSAITEFGEDENELGVTRVPPLTQAEIEKYARFHDPFNHPSVVYRKQAVEAVRGYQALPLMEDYLLFARMIAKGAKVQNVAQPLVLYRVGTGAYARRGGLRLLRSEIQLQRRLLKEGFTTRAECARNLAVRGGYRLAPEAVRRFSYRHFVVNRRRAGQ